MTNSTRFPKEHSVCGIISDAGGTLVGEERLQKTAYLLQHLNLLGTHFPFQSFRHCPYSEEFKKAVYGALVLGLTKEVTRTASWGGKYIVYDTSLPKTTLYKKRKGFLSICSQVSPVALSFISSVVYFYNNSESCPWEKVAHQKSLSLESKHIRNAKHTYTSLIQPTHPDSFPVLN